MENLYDLLPEETKEMIKVSASCDLDENLIKELFAMVYNHGYQKGKNENIIQQHW